MRQWLLHYILYTHVIVKYRITKATLNLTQLMRIAIAAGVAHAHIDKSVDQIP